MLRPAARLSLRVHVERHRPAFASEHVRPSISSEVPRKVDHAAGELRAGIERGRHVDLASRRVIGSQVVVRPGHDIEHAIPVEIGCSRAPGVVELVETLRAEPARRCLGSDDAPVEILERYVLESHLARSSGVQRDRTVTRAAILGRASRDVVRLVQNRANDVGIERHADGA